MLDSNGKEMLCYLSQNADLYRFVERFGQASAENSVPHRGSLLDKLARMTRSKEERVMAERGFKSRRQSLEESFWHRLAYHAFRELGTQKCVFEPGIEEASGAFTVTCELTGAGPIFRMTIPPRQVKRILTTFKEFLPNQRGLAIHPIPLKSIFKVTMDTKLDLEVRPVIRLLQESGEAKFFDREDLGRYHYGDLIYISGKWDLFKELLSESLDSGQKVVVYSQFVAMIRIIEKFLHDWGVGFVTLTGASRKRGEIISRFNEDPNIRIYVGSLRAGGAGIDLIAASVVIHYDRWWNAAKEDQATDRVHRIGQMRGVQVFKLVTEGTLEEKISAIIEKNEN